MDEDFRRGEGWIWVQDEFTNYDFDQQYNLLCKMKDLDPKCISMQNLRHGLFSWVCNVYVYVMCRLRSCYVPFSFMLCNISVYVMKQNSL